MREYHCYYNTSRLLLETIIGGVDYCYSFQSEDSSYNETQ